MLQTYYLLFFPNESRSTPDKKILVGFNFWSKQWVICIQPTIFKHSEAGYRILNTAKRAKEVRQQTVASVFLLSTKLFFCRYSRHSSFIRLVSAGISRYLLGALSGRHWSIYIFDLSDHMIFSHYIQFYIKLHSKSFSSYAISLHFVQWKVCAENETYNIPYNRYHSSCRSNCQNFLVWLQDNSASASQHQSETS